MKRRVIAFDLDNDHPVKAMGVECLGVSRWQDTAVPPDARGRVVGRVEGPMYGGSPETPDALSVRFSPLGRRRRLVRAGAIEAIDEGTKVIGLRIQRSAIRGFL